MEREKSIAVALRYDPNSMSAPTVIGKGKKLIAENIVEIAKKHKIPIIKNKSLAEALYRAIETGEEINNEFYEAVAEVLASLRRLKRK